MASVCAVHLCGVRMRYGVSVNWDEDLQRYSHSKIVTVDGKVERSVVRLSSGQTTVGMPVSLRLEGGDPLIFDDPISAQTQFLEKVLVRKAPIDSCIGEFEHSFGIHDELVDSPERISGFMLLPNLLFDEIANIVASSVTGIRGVSLDVFGENLSAHSDRSSTEYCWKIRDRAGAGRLFVGGFSYWL